MDTQQSIINFLKSINEAIVEHNISINNLFEGTSAVKQENTSYRRTPVDREIVINYIEYISQTSGMN